MPNIEATTEECYECGASLVGEVAYQSLYPETPNFHEKVGDIDFYSGFNRDYRVCHNDYKEQFARRYPDEPMPLGIRKQEAKWAAEAVYEAALVEGI